MSDKFLRNIDDVFSVLPESDNRQMSQEVFEAYLTEKERPNGSLKWIEYTENGAYVRCGISELADFNTSYLSSPQADPELAELFEFSKTADVNVGLVVRSENKEHCYWFVPYNPFLKKDFSKPHIRGLIVTEKVFFQILDIFNGDCGLTPSEKRVIYQLFIGMSVKDAADQDGVKVGTKREQTKSVFAKLRCSGQVGVIRLLMGQLVNLIYACNVETSDTIVSERFVNLSYPGQGELVVQRLVNNSIMRHFESGPKLGRPVVFLHGMIFPQLLSECEEVLEANNIRLFVPIRRGFLEDAGDAAVLGARDFFEKSAEDLRVFIDHTFKQPVPVVAHNLGAVYAVPFARQYGRLMSKLILVSIATAGPVGSQATVAQRFVDGLKRVAQNNLMLQVVAKRLTSWARTPEEMKASLARIYKNCDSDLSALDDLLGAGPPYQWTIDGYQASRVGINEDYRILISHWQRMFATLDLPIHMIQGPQSPMGPMEQTRRLASSNPNVALHELEEGGHLVMVSHPEATWKAISQCLD